MKPNRTIRSPDLLRIWAGGDSLTFTTTTDSGHEFSLSDNPATGTSYSG